MPLRVISTRHGVAAHHMPQAIGARGALSHLVRRAPDRIRLHVTHFSRRTGVVSRLRDTVRVASAGRMMCETRNGALI
jgi:hypothetical protein